MQTGILNGIQQLANQGIPLLPAPIKHIIKDTGSLFKGSLLENVSLLFPIMISGQLSAITFFPFENNKKEFFVSILGQDFGIITTGLNWKHKVIKLCSQALTYSAVGLIAAKILGGTAYAGLGLAILSFIFTQFIFKTTEFIPSTTLRNAIVWLISFSAVGSTWGFLLVKNSKIGMVAGFSLGGLTYTYYYFFPKKE